MGKCLNTSSAKVVNWSHVAQNKEERKPVVRTVTNFEFHRTLGSVFINQLSDFQFLEDPCSWSHSCVLSLPVCDLRHPDVLQ